MSKPDSEPVYEVLLPKEMTRVRDEVMPQYIKYGRSFEPALELLRGELDKAAKALAKGDAASMSRSYEKLAKYTLVDRQKPGEFGLMVRIPIELHARLVAQSAVEDRSQRAIVTRAIERELSSCDQSRFLDEKASQKKATPKKKTRAA